MAGAHSVFAATSGTLLEAGDTPLTYAEAMASPDGQKWRDAAKAEFDGCVAQGTWVLVKRSDLPKNTNIVPVKWVFKIKTNEYGAVTKYKARITPKGFKQRHGIDYFETFANTGKYKTLRVALSLAARRNLNLHQLDVPQAFTQAVLEEDVYMEMPEGFAVDGMVCLLKKSLYGLKQSPRNWYKLISTFIVDEMGFKATVSDPCLFVKVSRTGEEMILFLFVDDLQVGVADADEAEWAEYQALLKERFNITDLGESTYMLGMRIARDRAAGTITLSQEPYFDKALARFGLDKCKTAPTPGVKAGGRDSVMRDSPSRKREGGKASKPIDVLLYQEKVGTLMYAAISTRPDIAYAVNKLARHMLAPTAENGRACDRVFRYLAGTKSLGLVFGRNRDAKGISVSAYADADWGGDQSDRRSTTGWIAMLNGDPISWASKRQKVVSQSSCEAELYAEAAGINELKWLSGLLGELGVRVTSAPTLFGDNQSTQSLTRNGIKSERTKHIDIKYHFVTDEVEKGNVQLQWIPTTEQLADVLTKALGVQQHTALIKQLMAQALPSAPRIENAGSKTSRLLA